MAADCDIFRHPESATGGGALVDADVVDGPVGVLEGARVASDVAVARGRQPGTVRACQNRAAQHLENMEGREVASSRDVPRGVAAPNGSSPVAAERLIDDDLVLGKVRRYVAVALEVAHGRAPRRRVRTVAGDVGGDAGAREEPRSDGARGPLHGVCVCVSPGSFKSKSGKRGGCILTYATADIVEARPVAVGCV